MSNDRERRYAAERAQIAARPCSCVTCGTCKGHGSICVEMVTGRYIGPTPVDDLYDLERCDECEGGIVEVCQRCSAIEELDRLEDEES